VRHADSEGAVVFGYAVSQLRRALTTARTSTDPDEQARAQYRALA
jgi:hypothetical protein